MQWRYFYKGKINQCLISKSFLPDGLKHVSPPHCLCALNCFFVCTLARWLTFFLRLVACKQTMVHGFFSEFRTLFFRADLLMPCCYCIKSSLHRKTCRRGRCQLICCISHMIYNQTYLRPYMKLNCTYRPHTQNTRFVGAFTPCQYISI